MKSKFNEEARAHITQIMTMKTKFRVSWLECLLCGSQSYELVTNMTTVWYVWNAQVHSVWIALNENYDAICNRARFSVTFFVSFCEVDEAPGAFAAFVPLNDQVKSQDETCWQRKTHSQSGITCTVLRLNGVLCQGLPVRSSEQWHSTPIIAMNKCYNSIGAVWIWPIYWICNRP